MNNRLKVAIALADLGSYPGFGSRGSSQGFSSQGGTSDSRGSGGRMVSVAWAPEYQVVLAPVVKVLVAENLIFMAAALASTETKDKDIPAKEDLTKDFEFCMTLTLK
ncbi:hypothetical protein evm_011593 [Chilo suppressalis]|nr:hypothetical protein evm_011593 [Chilo suppressalis]